MNDEAHGKIIHQEQVGDSHLGRSVTILHYEDGSKQVFKPRCSAVDRAWVSFCTWLQKAGMPYAPAYVPFTQGEDGTYFEFVPHLPLPSVQAAKIYYLRCGALLCTCYLLGSKDMHCENLIARGDTPVLVDLEALLSGEPASFLVPPSPETSPAYSQEDNCVLLTSLLPHKRFFGDDVLELGGITGWNDSHNLPFLEDGTAVLPKDYLSPILEGFQTAYEWFLQNRDRLLQSPYTLFTACQLRILLRPTQLYQRLLNRLQQPDMQQSPTQYDRLLNKLSLAFTRYTHPRLLDRVLPICQAEKAALQRWDIPYFILHANDTALYDENDRLLCENYLRVSPWARTNAILNHLSPEDCALQCDMIRGAFHASYPDSVQKAAVAPLSLSPKEAARFIGRHLLEKAHTSKEGTPAWFVSCQAENGMGGVQPADHSLYSGCTGIALFLAALWKTLGEEAAYHAARELALSVIRQTERSFANKTYLRRSLGWADGLGGLMAGLWDISCYLADESLFPAHWLQYVDQAWIETDHAFDVLSGSAGLLLALGHCDIRDSHLASVLAQHILDGRSCWQGQRLIYRPEQESRPLTGFGHGATGIAAALDRAAAITHDPAFGQAALEMLQYENACYHPQQNNWPDFRHPTQNQPVFMHGWCAGAPGIGIGRSCMGLPCREAETWAADCSTLPRDHLCCGNAGLIDYFVITGQQQKAHDRAVALAARCPDYTFVTYNGPRVINAGLFCGLSGIGYALLRAEYPDVIRSILF